jgi:hypothetical protein
MEVFRFFHKPIWGLSRREGLIGSKKSGEIHANTDGFRDVTVEKFSGSRASAPPSDVPGSGTILPRGKGDP